jgi:maltooligosyltrehalose synthase
VAVPLHISHLSDNCLNVDWRDTKIILPPGINTQWKDLLKDLQLKEVYLKDIFNIFPLGILINQ